MAGKAKRQKVRDARREAKKRRKTANYLRFGPKENHKGKRQKKTRYGTHRTRTRTEPRNSSPTPPGPKARRRSKGLAIPAPNKGGKKYPKRPLRPLRKRRKMGSTRDH
ncbi:MAG: hypothetical protein ACWGQW_01475 [bacterium]